MTLDPDEKTAAGAKLGQTALSAPAQKARLGPATPQGGWSGTEKSDPLCGVCHGAKAVKEIVGPTKYRAGSFVYKSRWRTC